MPQNATGEACCLAIVADNGATLPAGIAATSSVKEGTVLMETKGRLNTALGANTFGFDAPGRFFCNLEAPALYEEALQRREAVVTSGGALLAETGVHTGRSP